MNSGIPLSHRSLRLLPPLACLPLHLPVPCTCLCILSPAGPLQLGPEPWLAGPPSGHGFHAHTPLPSHCLFSTQISRIHLLCPSPHLGPARASHVVLSSCISAKPERATLLDQLAPLMAQDLSLAVPFLRPLGYSCIQQTHAAHLLSAGAGTVGTTVMGHTGPDPGSDLLMGEAVKRCATTIREQNSGM